MILINIIITVYSLSQAKSGQKYRVEGLTLLKSLSYRMKLLGLSVGAMIEIIVLHKHGAVVKTPVGDIALDSGLLDSVQVSII